MNSRPGLIFLLSLLLFSSALHFSVRQWPIEWNGYTLRGWSWRDKSVDTTDAPKAIKAEKPDSVVCKKIELFPEKTREEIDRYVDSLEKFLSRPLSDSVLVESPFLVNCQRPDGTFPLDNFFQSLHTLSVDSSDLIRVAHYGDSQIEGDRLTDQLRILFQDAFVGNGVGFVPLVDITAPVSYVRQTGKSWTRYSIFNNKTKKYPYGIGGTCFLYDSSQTGTIGLQLMRQYQVIKLAYGKGSAQSLLEVYSGTSQQKLATHTLDQESDFNLLTLSVRSGEARLNFRFTGPPPVIYGFYFDPVYGIQFDNYGLRGQAGDGLQLIQEEHFRKMNAILNNRLTILEFGGNVAPGLRNEKAIALYGNLYKKTYGYVQRATDSISLLVIGVNDVSRSTGGGYKSYPNIGALRYAQRQHAVEQGMAFFDLLQWMGGENAIQVWYDRKLSSRDGHFSNRGRALLARAIFLSLMYEYRQFLKRKQIDAPILFP